MPAPYNGACQCGALAVEIAGEPLFVRQCWCRQCQKVSAGSPTNNAVFLTRDMTVSGEIAWHGYVAESGNAIEQGFCARCGTAAFGRNSARPDGWVVRLGLLDGDHGLSPTAAIWLDEAPAWAAVDPALEQHRRQPPAPPKA